MVGGHGRKMARHFNSRRMVCGEATQPRRHKEGKYDPGGDLGGVWVCYYWGGRGAPGGRGGGWWLC